QNFDLSQINTTVVFQLIGNFFYLFFTSTLLGAGAGLLSAYVIKKLYFGSWSNLWTGAINIFSRMNIGSLELGDYLAIGAIFSATDSVCTLQVLNQDQTPLLYSLVFGEGVVNDATSVVIFNAVQNFDLSQINTTVVFQLIGNFFYLFFTSTLLGAGVSF
nr:sodium/hydrogen exchanger 2-like [Tanacetum cinerariifolium]